MPEAKLKVQLISHTPEPLSVIYAAFRQCYHKGFVGDMWENLTEQELPQDFSLENTGENDSSEKIKPSSIKAISKKEQGEFVSKTIQSGHASPIEHVSFTFALSGVSRALTHQLVRHRIASFSQQSQRYVDASQFDYILPPSIAKNEKILARYEEFMQEVGKAYGDIKAMLEEEGRGQLAKEDARMVLPQAAASNIVLTMNCRSLINFFEHRCCTRAQWEIRACALKMLAHCRKVLPEVFNHAGARCESLGYCPEGEKFCCGRYPIKP